MIIVLACLGAGILAALFVPWTIPDAYSTYVAVAILAGLDSVFGGIAAAINNNFRMNIFISGFFGNAILAAVLTYIGNMLGIDLYFAAIIVFGTRLFQNFAIIRRFLLSKYTKEN